MEVPLAVVVHQHRAVALVLHAEAWSTFESVEAEGGQKCHQVRRDVGKKNDQMRDPHLRVVVVAQAPDVIELSVVVSSPMRAHTNEVFKKHERFIRHVR